MHTYWLRFYVKVPGQCTMETETTVKAYSENDAKNLVRAQYPGSEIDFRDWRMIS